MGLFSFIQGVGRRLGLGTVASEANAAEATPAPSIDMLHQELNRLGLPFPGIAIKVEGNTAILEGARGDREAHEKLILAVGNVAGIATVDDRTTTEDPKPGIPPSIFYTVKKGDTLSAISKAHYGEANRYTQIFEANRPMLDHPDRIYPGQVLRIPPQDAV